MNITRAPRDVSHRAQRLPLEIFSALLTDRLKTFGRSEVVEAECLLLTLENSSSEMACDHDHSKERHHNGSQSERRGHNRGEHVHRLHLKWKPSPTAASKQSHAVQCSSGGNLDLFLRTLSAERMD
jgi:hypothetical protein